MQFRGNSPGAVNPVFDCAVVTWKECRLRAGAVSILDNLPLPMGEEKSLGPIITLFVKP